MQYVAIGTWPLPQQQIDWIDQVASMEAWLTQYIGLKGVDWTWAKLANTAHPSKACVSFRRARDKTLFLLHYS